MVTSICEFMFYWLLLVSTTRSCVSPEQGESLILTSHIKNGNASYARQLSEVDPKKFLNVKSHSGYLTVKEEYNSNLFFWYFPHEKAAHVPWIIWLQGGPGASSMMGLFDLIGPIQIEDGIVRLRNVSWANDYSLVFVDNPVGAGFSFTDDDRGYPDNEDDVGEQLYEFLLQFLQMFPELSEAPLFLAGQSYAGKYVPALAIQIHRHRLKDDGDLENLRRPRHSGTINLRGLSIGNGMIDPRSMMHYTEVCGVLGLVEGKDLEKLGQLEEATVTLVDEKRMVDAANKFNETIEFIKRVSGVNIYNFDHDPITPGAPAFELFVNKPEVRRWIHAGPMPFDMNNQLVYTKMLPDIMNSTKPFVEELLEHYGVMSYSGQLDLILPYGMSKHTYKLLRWSRRQYFDAAPRKRLRRLHTTAVVGYKKSGGNFVEVLLRRAGHSVPADVPEVAKFLIDSFIDEFK